MAEGACDRDSRVYISRDQVNTLPFFSFLRLDRRDTSSGRLPSLFELAVQYSSHSCLVPHDHVFALLALSKDAKSFVPDYGDSMIDLAARVLDTCEQAAQPKDFESLMTILGANQDNVTFACCDARNCEAEDDHQHP